MKMVTKEEVERLMLRYLPLCPLCGANTGYEVSGFWTKSFVQCRSCRAKWQLLGKELNLLQLWEPSDDGRGATINKLIYPVKFWQDSNAIEKVIEEEKKGKSPDFAMALALKNPENNIRQMVHEMMGATEGYGRYKTYKGEIPLSLREMIWTEEHKPDRFLMAMKPFYIKWREFLHSEDLRVYVEWEKGKGRLASLVFSRDFSGIISMLNVYSILLVTANVSLAAISYANSLQSVYGNTDPNKFLQQVLENIDRALGM